MTRYGDENRESSLLSWFASEQDTLWLRSNTFFLGTGVGFEDCWPCYGEDGCAIPFAP